MMSSRFVLLMCTYLIFVGGAPSPEQEQFCNGPDWFRCGNERCLSTFFVCDGEDDCGDRSDEKNCPDVTTVENDSNCMAEQFQCSDYNCIPLDDFCNAVNDCLDGSDEYIGCAENKSCYENETRCLNGQCVRNSWICDGIGDCSDLSDEADCENRTATQSNLCEDRMDRFLCNNGRCIALNETCDGNDDCGDNSDENSAGCADAEELCKNGSGCSHLCNKTPNGPVCSCPAGHELMNNQTCSDINECIGHPEICDQHCVNTVGSYICVCEDGYELRDDTKTCKVTAGEGLMIFSVADTIRGIYLESEIYFPIVNSSHGAVGVSMDANYLYSAQTEKQHEAIVRRRDDGSNDEIIVTTGLGSPQQIAIDWITGNIYFTDRLRKYIGACKNDGSQCTVIIREVDEPRGLVLFPMNGEMYWSNSGAQPHISIAGMDGKESRILISENLGSPGGLAIDYPSGRLYWADTERAVIEFVRLDGTERREVLSFAATHPYSIAIFEDKMYWSDLENGNIYSAGKSAGENRRIVIKDNNTVNDIHIYHSLLQPKLPNHCHDQPCSQLCLLATNQTYSCACTLGNVLSTDNHSCEAIVEKQEHLDSSSVCDVNADKAKCGKNSCKSEEFQCSSGQCISQSLVCDGRKDCVDHTDEINCVGHICRANDFRCSSGNCVPENAECDGVDDCGDNSDEDSERCKNTACTSEMFSCANNRCLGQSLVCNGEDNCGDNSDEENCDSDGAISWEVQVSPDGKVHFANVEMRNFTFPRFWAPGRSTTFRFSQRLAVAVEPNEIYATTREPAVPSN